MIRIDSHQHFWKYDPIRHDWINNEMEKIRFDFLPENMLPVLKKNSIDGCIAIQAEHTKNENHFLSALSAKHDFIKGVVGWVDLQSKAVKEELNELAQFSCMKGIRHILQGESQKDLMLTKPFLNGIKELDNVGFSYDILVSSDQLQYVPEFVAHFPNQRFVLDHLGKPPIKSRSVIDWKKDIELIARHENVHCKISGMLTEADLRKWKKKHFTPYLDIAVEAFGIKRVMYGSDWPVCLAVGNYKVGLTIVKSYFGSFSEDEQALFFGKNAIDFYRL